MRISPINYSLNYKPINFTSTQRSTYKTEKQGIISKPFYDKECNFLGYWDDGKLLCSNATRFFRDDLPWEYLGEKLDKLFPDGKKVNVFNFACSDGSEPYSLAICLIEQLGEEKAKRFFPIQASDKDSYIISKAKSGTIRATKEDIENISEISNGKIDKYFDVKRQYNGGYTLVAKDILKDNVKFSRKNFYDGLDDLKGENNLVLCRNFWGYLEEDEVIKSAKKLYKNLDKSSIVLIGVFDMDKNGVPNFLAELGIDCATDDMYEENILSKHLGYSNGNYSNEDRIRKEIRDYHYKKTRAI